MVTFPYERNILRNAKQQPIVIKYAKTNNNLTNTDRPGVNKILFSLNSGPYHLHRDIMAKCENTDSLF